MNAAVTLLQNQLTSVKSTADQCARDVVNFERAALHSAELEKKYRVEIAELEAALKMLV